MRIEATALHPVYSLDDCTAIPKPITLDDCTATCVFIHGFVEATQHAYFISSYIFIYLVSNSSWCILYHFIHISRQQTIAVPSSNEKQEVAGLKNC